MNNESHYVIPSPGWGMPSGDPGILNKEMGLATGSEHREQGDLDQHLRPVNNCMSEGVDRSCSSHGCLTTF